MNFDEFRRRADAVRDIPLEAVLTCRADLPKEAFTPQLEAFLPLSSRIETLASNLDKEI